MQGCAWTTPTLPARPIDEPSVHTVPEAFLTRVTHGRLRSAQRPTRWIRGAVHDSDGRLVVASQMINANGHDVVAADPETVAVREEVRGLGGQWIYGGHWFRHFGHFVLETLTTLWPEGLQVDGVLFHRWTDLRFWKDPYHDRMIELAGYGGVPLRAVGRRPVRVERLHVPSRSLAAEGWAHPQAHHVWQRLAAPFRAAGGPRRVYLSRTAVNAAHRERQSNRGRGTSPERDAACDRIFEEAGFAVVRPETLPVDEQLRTYAGAEVVAGLQSSALHLAAACAPPGGRVLQLCDSRYPELVAPNQRSVDVVGGHLEACIPASVPIEEIPDRLVGLGLL